MQTIFITGASSGIGKATAELFSARGWRVIATMRNLKKGEDLSKLPNVIVMPLDVTDVAQIRETCQSALEKYDVDVLLNNAGYAIMGALERLPEEAIRTMLNTDFLGTVFVTQQFIPHFKARRSGVIMTTTSLAAFIAFPRDGIYGAAKRAQQSMVESLYLELKPFGVSVKSMIPGGTKTNFQIPFNDLTGYEEPAARQRQYVLDGNEEFPEPTEAAEIIYGAATDGEDRLNYPTDSVCRKLYDEYRSMDVEEFKNYLYEKFFV